MRQNIRSIGILAATFLLALFVRPAAAQLKYLPMTAKVVTICASGCRYTSLNAACAANTSTAASPITYMIGPGVFSGTQASCSGEDYATIRGSGQASTIFTATGITSENGDLELGTSSNITVEDIWFKNCHRCIVHEPANTNAGTITIRRNRFTTERVNLDEDCVWYDQPGSGTEYHFEYNHCNSGSDGFTLNGRGNGVRVYGVGNTFTHDGTVTSPGFMNAWSFEGTPCLFDSTGDTIDMAANGTGSVQGISYSAIDDVNGCTAGKANIVGLNARVRQTAVSGATFGFGITVEPAATKLAQLNCVGCNVFVDNDSASGNAIGHKNNASGSVSNIVGGNFQSETAGSKTDFSTGSGTTNLYGVAYGNDAGTADIVAGDIKNFTSSKATFTAQALFSTASVGATAIKIDQTDAVTDRTSPYLRICNGGASEECCNTYVSDNGDWEMTCSSNQIFDARFGPDLMEAYFTRWAIFKQNASLELGNSTAGDNFLCTKYRAGTDATQCFNDDADRMDFAGATQTRFATKASPPASCVIGDFYIDTSGAACFCTVAGTPGTWENAVTTGTCV